MARLTVAALLAALLVPWERAAGAGIALAAGYVVYAGYLFVTVRADHMRARAAWSVLRALAVATVAAGAGQLLQLGDGATELALAVTISTVTWVAMAMLLTRPELLSLIRLLRRHLRRTPRPAQERAEPA